MKLRVKYITAFVLTALLPIAALGYLNYRSAKEALKDQAIEDLVVTAEAKEGHLYSFMEAQKGRALDFSSDGLINVYAGALQKSDTGGSQYRRIQRSLNTHLKHNKKSLDKSIQAIDVIGINGKVIASTDNSRIDTDEGAHECFIQGKNGVCWHDVHVSANTADSKKLFQIAVSAPLTDKRTGDLLGVIVNYYHASILNKILSGEFQVELGAPSGTAGRRKTYDIYLVNSDRLLITPSRFCDEVLTRKVETLPVIEGASGKEISGIYENFLGNEVLGASMYIPARGWILLVEISTGEAFSSVTTLRNRVVILSIPIVILAIFLAFLLSKESQGLIQETTQRLQAIMQSSPQAIISMETDGRVKSWNTAAERMFGWSEKEVVGKPLPIIPEEKQGEFSTLQSVALKGTSFTDKDAIRQRKDGSPINVSISAAPLYSTDGAVEGIMELVTDITERKRNEEQLRKLLQAVEQSPATVLITDTNGSIEYVNPKFSQLTGYTREEAIGKNPRVLKSGKTPPEEYKRLWETITTGGEWRGVFLNRKKDGGLYWESASISAVKNHQGVITHFVAVKEDITNHVKADEQVRLQLQRMSGLHDIDVAITGNFDLNYSLNVFLNKVTVLLGVDAADVLLFNAQRQRLEYAGGYGFDTDAIRRSSLLPGEGTAGRAASEQRMVHVPDLGKASEAFARAKLLAEEGFVAYYAIPLIAKEHVHGVLEIFHRKPITPDKEWLEFLEILATQGAILVDHALLFADLQRSNTELVMAYDRTIEGWSCALDMRDQETEGHTQRVVALTLKLARAMGVGEEKLIHVRRGALLHDIGKIGVPDHILHKPGPLLDDEWVIMRQHPIYAFAMLSPISYLSQALDIPYCHHEKWDGSGYPRGLKGDQIPLLARIFAVVDVWDALRFDRPYRKGMADAQALEYIRSNTGTHFDPQVVAAFLKLDGK